jgi:hypothetical protein
LSFQRIVSVLSPSYNAQDTCLEPLHPPLMLPPFSFLLQPTSKLPASERQNLIVRQ